MTRRAIPRCRGWKQKHLFLVLLWLLDSPGLLHVHSHNHHHHHHHHPDRILDGEDNVEHECGAEEATAEDLAMTMKLVEDWESAEKKGESSSTTSSGIRARSSSFSRTIPVYVHIIVQHERQTTTTGELTNADIIETIRLLNVDYSKTPFQFQLKQAKKHVNYLWYRCNKENDDAFKRQLRMGGKGALNLYICDTSSTTLRGWASYPWKLADDRYDALQDGAVVSYKAIYRPSVAIPYSKNEPRPSPNAYYRGTLTHEVGHFLGLYHTYQGGCKGSGDGVKDTPAHIQTTTPCTVPDQNTCSNTKSGVDPGMDPRDNFMDTGNDECRARFTPGQINRMIVMWNSFRRTDSLPLQVPPPPPPTTVPAPTTPVPTAQPSPKPSPLPDGNDAAEANGRMTCVAQHGQCSETAECCHDMICAPVIGCLVEMRRKEILNEAKTDQDKIFFLRSDETRGNLLGGGTVGKPNPVPKVEEERGDDGGDTESGNENGGTRHRTLKLRSS